MKCIHLNILILLYMHNNILTLSQKLDEDLHIFCCSDDIIIPDVDESINSPRVSFQKCLEYSDCEEKPQVFSIVGGYDADLGEFPFMTAIGWKLSGVLGHMWMCGGSLISEQFVLTAAHCAYSQDSTLVSSLPDVVRLGSLYLKKPNQGAMQVKIDKIIIHPEYKPPNKYHDIALIKLVRPVRFTEYIRPICLWQNKTIDQDYAVATGWGKLNFTGPSSDILMKVDLLFVKRDECSKHYPKKRFLTEGIIRGQICAGSPDDGKDTCQGDSGGPLTIQSKKKPCIYHQVAVTSFGVGCGTKIPAVYTNVFIYLNWIESIVWP